MLQANEIFSQFFRHPQFHFLLTSVSLSNAVAVSSSPAKAGFLFGDTWEGRNLRMVAIFPGALPSFLPP